MAIQMIKLLTILLFTIMFGFYGDSLEYILHTRVENFSLSHIIVLVIIARVVWGKL